MSNQHGSVATTDWITPGAAGRILGVGNRTLAKLASDGRIAAKKLPSGHRRYDRASVEALDHGLEQAGTTALAGEQASA